MDDSPDLENRFKLVMELNELLEDIVKVNKELSLMKRENINFLIQNRSIEKDISDNEELLTQLKEKNEFLSKESVKINNDIQILKEELK